MKTKPDKQQTEDNTPIVNFEWHKIGKKVYKFVSHKFTMLYHKILHSHVITCELLQQQTREL